LVGLTSEWRGYNNGLHPLQVESLPFVAIQ
jgi:hypothetical protein